jgi:hypothetical protein
MISHYAIPPPEQRRFFLERLTAHSEEIRNNSGTGTGNILMGQSREKVG